MRPAADPSTTVGAEPVPKYFRIKQAVLQRIATGVWAPGAMIPSEVELCREFGVSRTTARKAVSDLAYEGRLNVVQGKGTFVAIPKVEEHFIQRAFGIHEDMQRRGITLTTQVLRQEVEEASPEVARRLELRRGEPVHLIVRLRFVDEEPMLISTTYVPYSLCPDLTKEDLTECSLYALLRDRYGLAIARGERRLEAVAADGREARLLDIALGSPLLLLDSVAYAADGRPFEHSVALQRGDRTTVEVEFLATPDDLAVGQVPGPTTERTAAELIADSLTETQ
jgi:DNA-binding GntR family transcriptional regulator